MKRQTIALLAGAMFLFGTAGLVRAGDCPTCAHSKVNTTACPTCAHGVAASSCPTCTAFPKRAGLHGNRYTGPWHGQYYSSTWGMPVAVVVPPTAATQTHWGWGVGATRVTPIYPQFQRNMNGGSVYNVRQFRPTPPWPSSTDQFGVYPVRAPW
ncbi:hypothetical protein JCM19992_02960 [Thermostilla marina]